MTFQLMYKNIIGFLALMQTYRQAVCSLHLMLAAGCCWPELRHHPDGGAIHLHEQPGQHGNAAGHLPPGRQLTAERRKSACNTLSHEQGVGSCMHLWLKFII